MCVEEMTMKHAVSYYFVKKYFKDDMREEVNISHLIFVDYYIVIQNTVLFAGRENFFQYSERNDKTNLEI